MGRGRAKAKQTKIARELKYSPPVGTDLDRLRAELAAGDAPPAPVAAEDDDDLEDDDDVEDEVG